MVLGRWDVWIVNPLEREHRYLGPRVMYYDGPIYTFGFWWFNCGAVADWGGRRIRDEATP